MSDLGPSVSYSYPSLWQKDLFFVDLHFLTWFFSFGSWSIFSKQSVCLLLKVTLIIHIMVCYEWNNLRARSWLGLSSFSFLPMSQSYVTFAHSKHLITCDHMVHLGSITFLWITLHYFHYESSRIHVRCWSNPCVFVLSQSISPLDGWWKDLDVLSNLGD